MLLGCNHALNILHFKDGTKSAISPTALADLQRFFSVKSSSDLQSALDIVGSLEEAIDLLLESGQY